ncbi:MAG: 2-hydroxyhepta-2,4-diene-1,7-dioate isomerase [Chloroflexi bacterium RBG_19FT_COMBO_62_14]|nr:MAG: 2-hydroxyhepta-2,4-diene-1,7-dioate isomerase [Chloroflexi bacterium RBG_19FT_COMBO_62_14]
MRILRFRQGPGAEPAWGWLEDDRVGGLEGSPFTTYRRLEATIPLESVQLAAPVVPSKIVCVGRNYAAHAAEHNAEVPKLPLLFLKAPSAIIAMGETILLPAQSHQVEHEAELAVVIGRRGRWITPEAAREHILGYTAVNDVTARDLQNSDGQWSRSKSFDTFCPLGPWIETDLDPAEILVKCLVNGQLRQMASTRDMIFPVPQLVAFISSAMTLEPGDLILTGTPAGVSQLASGDEVTVDVEGVGQLRNPVGADRRTG